jgi:hypothetical protein
MQVSRRIEEFFCADGAVARERLTGRILLGGGLTLLSILVAELRGPTSTIPEPPEPVVRSAE